MWYRKQKYIQVRWKEAAPHPQPPFLEGLSKSPAAQQGINKGGGAGVKDQRERGLKGGFSGSPPPAPPLEEITCRKTCHPRACSLTRSHP